MSTQTSSETLEEIVSKYLKEFGVGSAMSFTATLLSDPAILDHIPAVKALREENAKAWAAVRSTNQLSIDERKLQARITDLESQLAELRQGGEVVANEFTVKQVPDGWAFSAQGVGAYRHKDSGDVRYCLTNQHTIDDWEDVLIVPMHGVVQPAIPPGYVVVPSDNDGKEQDAFEEWAKANRYDMTTHPLHWLFLDGKTYAARDGWRGALQYVAKALAAAPSVPVAEKALPENVKLLLLKAHRQLETEYRQQTRATEAKRVANGTCGESPGGASSIALLAESGYISSIGKRNQEVRDEIFAMLAAPADSKEGSDG